MLLWFPKHKFFTALVLGKNAAITYSISYVLMPSAECAHTTISELYGI
jgi:hypothetical protein